METKIIFYFIAIAGVAFHLMMKYRDSYTKNEKFPWVKQLMFALFSVPTALILVYFKDVVIGLNDIDLTSNPKLVNIIEKLMQFLCFFIGYFADSVWKNVEATGRAKLNVKE